MFQGEKALVVVLMAFATTVGVYADMMPISPVDKVSHSSAHTYDRANCEPRDWPEGATCLAVSDPDFLSVASFAVQYSKAELADPGPQSIEILTSDQGSLDLCLYTLLGLGLCRSGHWVRRSGLGLVPEWYHSGGPYQIGHSHAIGPDLLRFAPVTCFVQPDCRAEDSPLQYGIATIASLWQESQCIPTILAPRGPPSLAHESLAA